MISPFILTHAVFVRERERVCVCVCVRERERERELIIAGMISQFIFTHDVCVCV